MIITKRLTLLISSLLLSVVLSACASPTLEAGPDDFVGLEPNVVNGTETPAFSRPYQVWLGGCGGTLISDTWVVTAAHCFDEGDPASDTTVTVGLHDRSAQQGERIGAKSITLHPDYSGVGGNDIALIELNSPITDENAVPIKLPTQAVLDNAASPGKFATVSGWGATGASAGLATRLREADLEIMSVAACDGVSSNICGDYTQERSACFGDSGGPFAVRYQDEFYHLGIVSGKGPGGAACEASTIFTRVSSFLDWIEAETGVTPEDNDDDDDGDDGEGTLYQGSLSGVGEQEAQPDGTFFESAAGSHVGTLSGPDDADFNLYLYKWDSADRAWETVGRGTNNNSEETVTYEGDEGYYIWLVNSRQGSGEYSLELTRP